MRLARIQTPEGPRPVVADGDDWAVVEDLFATPPVPTGERHPQDGAVLLAPVEPRVVLGMAHNGEPGDRDLPIQAFMKSARTVVGPGDPIVLDPAVGSTKGECELVLVIGRTARNVGVDDAADVILGWTVGNDVTNLDQTDSYATQVKNGDGYTPLGPWIETELPEPFEGGLVAALAGSEVARSSTSALAWNPYEVLAHLSHYMTLGPGDVILTGAPSTSFPITPGDECSCTVEAVGTLTNPVVGIGHE